MWDPDRTSPASARAVPGRAPKGLSLRRLPRGRPHLGAALLLAFTSVAAAAPVGDPGLARWLAASAAPELAERLRRHPRLAGVTVRVGTAAAREGRVPDALAAAVAEQLEAELRRQRGVRLFAGEDRCAAPGAVELLVDTGRTAGGLDRVDAEFLDPVTGHWLSGLGSRWEGRLSAPARRARGRAAPLAADGSRDRPFPPGARDAAADRLAASLRCRLSRPHAWTGGIGEAFDGTVPALEARLRERLADRLAPPGADPAWVLRLDRRDGAVRLLLDGSGAGSGGAVEIARVHLLPSPAPGDPGDAVVWRSPARGRAGLHDAGATSFLFEGLTVAPAPVPGGVCRGEPRGCWRIDVAFVEPVWSVVAWTGAPAAGGAGRLAVTDCDRGPGAPAKARRFRLRNLGPGVAVLVLATRSEQAARAAQRILAAAPGACGSSPDESALAHWLEGLDQRLAGLPGTVEWRLATSAPVPALPRGLR